MSKNSPAKKQLFDVHEAAELLGVNPGTIRRWAQSKQLHGLKVGIRGDWRFTSDDLLLMAKESSLESTNTATRLILTGKNKAVQKNDEVESLSLMSIPHLDWTEMNNSEHFVQYYESDSYLLDSLSRFIGIGLLEGEACIVVATKKHREHLEERLSSYGIDIVGATVTGQLTMLDARGTLNKFYKNGIHDQKQFFKVIGDLIRSAFRKKKKVRIFGEMVALLWAGGERDAAVHLEQLWNAIGKMYSFSLYCAYPMKGFNNTEHRDSFNDIVHSHTKVIPTESYTSIVDQDERLRMIAYLQQKAKSLESEIIERRKAEKRKDEFLGMASHELKTPVTSLKAYVQMLVLKYKNQGDEKSAQMFSKMDLQINKLSNLISDLLDVTKVEAGKLQFKKEAFDLHSLVKEVTDEVQITSEGNKIKIDALSKSLVYGDRDRIGQVMTNLLSNAQKYSSKGDSIVITTRKKNNFMQISIRDYGIGIKKEDRERIFDRFYRVEGSIGETFAGLGLGLYISREIVKDHGGKIWVEANNDRGSTFYFTIPLYSKK